ncbi:SPFH domain-containing protein [Candidatus Bathyarchaeota archaeon]|nr:SPFH domain-containing protein [Candidatus Bathyarchaeota archaeon]
MNEDERVAVYVAGNFRSLLSPGQHPVVDDFDSAVYVDVSPRTEKVGIRAPNYPVTSDGKSFGCSGNIEFRVQEDQVAVGNFLSKLVGTDESYPPKTLANWLRDGLLFQVFKEIIKDYTYNEFIEMERMRLLMELEVKLGAELRGYGVEMVTLELRHFTPPKSF